MREDVLRIVVADDQATVREGLVLLLGQLPDIDVVGAAADGAHALELVAEHHPVAILLDLHMPVLDGVQTSALLSERHPDVAIVILTTYADDTSVLGALRAGAHSYLTKDADRLDIARTLHAAANGFSVLDPAVHSALLAAAGDPAPPTVATPVDLPDGLTPREAEILTLIGTGATNPEIAEQLCLSRHTVKSHVNRIFAKTGSVNRGAAIRYAREHRLGRS